MKKLKFAIIALSTFILIHSAKAQGFVNLNFESANIPNGTSPGSYIPISDGLPGWSGYYTSSTSTNVATQVAYEGISLGGNVISIIDTNVGFGFSPIQGTYSAFLFGGGSGTYYAATISQTGLVPAGTATLLMDASFFGANFVVKIGGETISMIPLQNFSNYTIYGADISSFAGTTTTLSFTEPPATGVQPGGLLLDNIQFSSTPVPEPSDLALLVLGGLFLGYMYRRK